MKGLVTRITYVKYENPSTYFSKVLAKVKVISQVQKSPRPKGRGYWYPRKVFQQINAFVKYTHLNVLVSTV